MLDFGFYNMDCMDGMKEFPDQFFDLAIVDPPYGINAGRMTMGSGKHIFKNDKDWDQEIPDKSYFNELFRVSKNQIIFGGNYFTEYLSPSANWIVWDKMNPRMSFAEGELAWMRFGDNLRIYSYYTVQAAKKHPKIHPTQKPIELYKWLINRYMPGGVHARHACRFCIIACRVSRTRVQVCWIRNRRRLFQGGKKTA